MVAVKDSNNNGGTGNRTTTPDTPVTTDPPFPVITASMSLRGTLDDYPQGFAWSLTNVETQEELFVHLPGSLKVEAAELHEPMKDLLPGQYDFQVGDNGMDGIWYVQCFLRTRRE